MSENMIPNRSQIDINTFQVFFLLRKKKYGKAKTQKSGTLQKFWITTVNTVVYRKPLWGSVLYPGVLRTSTPSLQAFHVSPTQPAVKKLAVTVKRYAIKYRFNGTYVLSHLFSQVFGRSSNVVQSRPCMPPCNRSPPSKVRSPLLALGPRGPKKNAKKGGGNLWGGELLKTYGYWSIVPCLDSTLAFNFKTKFEFNLQNSS